MGMGTVRAVQQLAEPPTPGCGALLQELHPLARLAGVQEDETVLPAVPQPAEHCGSPGPCVITKALPSYLCLCCRWDARLGPDEALSTHIELLPPRHRAQLALLPLLLSPEVWVTHF